MSVTASVLIQKCQSSPGPPGIRDRHGNKMETPWLGNGGHGASLNRRHRVPPRLPAEAAAAQAPAPPAPAHTWNISRSEPRRRLRFPYLSMDFVLHVSSHDHNRGGGGDSPTFPPVSSSVAPTIVRAIYPLTHPQQQRRGRRRRRRRERSLTIDAGRRARVGLLRNVIEAPWLGNSGNGASLRHHKRRAARAWAC